MPGLKKKRTATEDVPSQSKTRSILHLMRSEKSSIKHTIAKPGGKKLHRNNDSNNDSIPDSNHHKLDKDPSVALLDVIKADLAKEQSHMDSLNKSDGDLVLKAATAEDSSDDDMADTQSAIDDDHADMLGGVEAESPADADGKLPPRKKKRTTHIKPPTHDEIQQLKDTSELFKSNLFKLQLEEMLSEVRVKYTRMTTLDGMLHKLKNFFDTLEPRDEVSLEEAQSTLASEGVSIPFPSPAPPGDIKCSFAFQRPSKVSIIGSYLLKTISKSKHAQSVDMAVQMPDEIFGERDHINHRYFYKRAYYLAVIASELNKQKKGLGIELTYQVLDSCRSALVISFSDVSETDTSSSFQIRILPCISPSLFPASRLAPSRNSVRSPTSPPTPKYNTSILSESSYISHLNYMYTAIQGTPALMDASILVKVWLRQRGLGDYGFLCSVLMAWLVKTGPSGKGVGGGSLSSYQILKLVMQFMASNEFVQKSWFLTSNAKPLSTPDFSEATFEQHFEVVIVDPSGRLNLAAQVSKHGLLQLHHEAKLAIMLFNNSTEDKFEALFLRNVEEGMLKFDMLATITTPATQLPIPRLDDGTDVHSQHDYLISRLPEVLSQALGSRLQLVTVRSPPLQPTPINISTSHNKQERQLQIGMLIDAEESMKAVKMGPDANDHDASKAFCQLWGEKAEVRRFRDGSIKYSVVFEADESTGRSGILPRMIQYLIKRHVGVTATIWGTQLDVMLSSIHELRPSSFTPVMEALASLGKALREMDDLPLSVTSLIPISSELTYTSVFIPTSSSPSYNSPMEVIVQLESSNRWPDDLQAIHKFKVAFLIKMIELLAQVMPGVTAKVAAPDSNEMKEGWADVTIPSGFAFRLFIQNEREFVVLERQLSNVALDIKQRDVLTRAKTQYEHLYIRKPRHAALISNIATRFPSYSSITRLVKRWVSSHLLSRFISDEVLEVICAKVVTDSQRGAMWTSPSLHLVGMMRVLYLLATHSWSTDALLVELSVGGVTAEVINKVSEAFKMRGSGKDMFVASEEDVEGTWFKTPNGLILNRLRALAAAAVKVWSSCVSGGCGEDDLLKLFVTPTTGYDFIIRLNPTILPRYRQNLTCDASLLPKARQQYKNLRVLQDAQEDDWDPAERYVQELEESYQDLALFFHDRYGGDAVGVLFNPMAIAFSGSFKVNTPYAFTPNVTMSDDKSKKNAISPNYLSMASEMQRRGNGLVGYIDYRKATTS
ncbi:hypothetical protein SmJEL517_g05826 [Synchytrium microbalum]|uniref:U3 small nucleolar RNA-associated protein 22 n=1 Tax=Synchytrium microbalum TaxID=1806994 RepID=A0A507BUD7_9FUNG|nr:uncharacterized protein SmJEL517_g05826 [Synchytrium microbalum]TPX30639.1 hypothetical protein SmJEL517_g05826 [Synchytrium microbalum]